MSDSLEKKFSDFRTAGLNGPSAQTIRERGDAMRRRRNITTGLAALATLTVIGAVPFALMQNDESTSLPISTAPTQTPNESPGVKSDYAIQPEQILTVEDLPQLPDGVSKWTSNEPSATWACDTAAASKLDSESSAMVEYGAHFLRGDGTQSFKVREEVLIFKDENEAFTARNEALGLLVDCEAAKGFFKFDGSEEGRTAMSAFSYGAPEACEGDCDATWFDYMGVAQDGNRVILLSYAQIAGPLPPEGDLRSDFFSLLDRAVEVARD